MAGTPCASTPASTARPARPGRKAAGRARDTASELLLPFPRSTNRKGTTMARLTQLPLPGSGITVHGWSDSHAYTVLHIVGKGGRFVAQRDKATRTNREADTFSPGGFAGHTESPNGQQWSYEADPEGATITVTLRKDGTWRPAGQGTKPVSEGRSEHYDYNF